MGSDSVVVQSGPNCCNGRLIRGRKGQRNKILGESYVVGLTGDILLLWDGNNLVQ